MARERQRPLDWRQEVEVRPHLPGGRAGLEPPGAGPGQVLQAQEAEEADPLHLRRLRNDLAVQGGLGVQASDLCARRRVVQAGRINGPMFDHSNSPLLRAVVFQQPRVFRDGEDRHAWLITAASSLPPLVDAYIAECNRFGVTMASCGFDGRATRIAKPHNFGAFIKGLACSIIHCCAIAVVPPGSGNGQ